MSGPLTLPLRVVVFALWFAKAVVVSAGALLKDVLTPRLQATPRVVRLPLDSRRDGHVAVIGALITLTPGTLTLGVVDSVDGRRALLVHSMYHDDEESAVTELRDMEARMLHALTLRGTP